MGGNGVTNFIYLNRENRWADFELSKMEVGPDGTLTLAVLPSLTGQLPAGARDLPAPAVPAGVAGAPDGTLYMSDPDGNRLLMVDPCDGALAPAPCVGGVGDRPGQLRAPRGVLYHPLRRAVFVVDSGNHRVQIFEPKSFHLVGMWGQPSGVSGPSADPGRFDTPWTLAADHEGSVYVVDYGNRRVQKFDLAGDVVPAFSNTVQQTGALQEPTDIAVGDEGGATVVYVLDRSRLVVCAFDGDGRLIRTIAPDALQRPMGLWVHAGALYVGDNALRRLLKFAPDGTLLGEARGYEGPVAAVGSDPKGGLLVHNGSAGTPLRVALAGAYVARGVAWGGPFGAPGDPRRWYRLAGRLAVLQPGAHLRVFVRSSNESTPPSVDPSATDPFADPGWHRQAPDVAECTLLGPPARYLWVGLEFRSEGLTSPALSQIKVEFDHETYLRYLPAIYRTDPSPQPFWTRFLALFESVFGDAEGEIRSLRLLFDPAAVPAEFLPWLAGWLAVDLEEAWPAAKKREVIAEAFAMDASRGTVNGLRAALRVLAGVEAWIEEPLLNAAWWCLASGEAAPPLERQGSILGFTTMLASAQAQGAVVGTTAVLDQSHLISGDEFGAPLFADVAHRFTVQVYAAQVRSPAKLNEVRGLIERWKPAHTAYHLCLIQPRMRVAMQARLGIDTVIAGPPEPTPAASPAADAAGLVLAGDPPGRLGRESRVGKTTRLGDAAVGI